MRKKWNYNWETAPKDDTPIEVLLKDGSTTSMWGDNKADLLFDGRRHYSVREVVAWRGYGK
jgi:hypothetical protein